MCASILSSFSRLLRKHSIFLTCSLFIVHLFDGIWSEFRPASESSRLISIFSKTSHPDICLFRGPKECPSSKVSFKISEICRSLNLSLELVYCFRKYYFYWRALFTKLRLYWGLKGWEMWPSWVCGVWWAIFFHSPGKLELICYYKIIIILKMARVDKLVQKIIFLCRFTGIFFYKGIREALNILFI